MSTSSWGGRDDRECGEHRPTINRAWCFDCSEWCYPHSPCVRCEVPELRAIIDKARSLTTDAESELVLRGDGFVARRYIQVLRQIVGES